MNMKKQQTKEELLIQNAKLQKEVDYLVDSETKIRKEFSRAFSIFTMEKGMLYDFDREPADISWEQIFVELGKLLSARTFYDFDGNISELQCKLENLEKEFMNRDEKHTY